MPDGTELTQLLTAYDTRETDRATQDRERQTQDASKTENFATVSSTVIRPAMDEIGEQLRTHGHTFAIREQPYLAPALRGGRQDARISMDVLPSRYQQDQHGSGTTPWLSFAQRSPRVPITIYRSMIMPGGAGGNGHVGDHAIDEITPELVRQVIMDWLTLVLR